MYKHEKIVRIWLFIGLIMLFFQIVIGGITRLTGSGLSITRWEIVTGAIPPLNALEWEESFNDYRRTPQYKKLNRGMTMGEFKFIYFWEYLHRLWARSLGFVFVVPLGLFMLNGMISKWLLGRLAIIFILGGIAGVFGWIMVKSGLIERPWVSAYRLTIHLFLALVVVSYLLITFLEISGIRRMKVSRLFRNGLKVILSLTVIQVILGGLMAGMKASLVYPTFPDYGGHFFPPAIAHATSLSVDILSHYDTDPLMPAVVQFLHRSIAYVLIISMIYIIFKTYKEWKEKRILGGLCIWSVVLIIQILLGIITLINSVGRIPVLWGVLHQGTGIIYLSLCLYFIYITGRKKEITEFPENKF